MCSQHEQCFNIVSLSDYKYLFHRRDKNTSRHRIIVHSYKWRLASLQPLSGCALSTPFLGSMNPLV